MVKKIWGEMFVEEEGPHHPPPPHNLGSEFGGRAFWEANANFGEKHFEWGGPLHPPPRPRRVVIIWWGNLKNKILRKLGMNFIFRGGPPAPVHEGRWAFGLRRHELVPRPIRPRQPFGPSRPKARACPKAFLTEKHMLLKTIHVMLKYHSHRPTAPTSEFK